MGVLAGTHPPRLLIVAYHFPPDEAVGARRPAALARIAAGDGWDVRILCSATTGDQASVPGLGPDDVIRARSWRLPGRRCRPPVAVDPPSPGGPTSPSRLAGVRALVGRIARPIRYLAREALHLPDPQAGWIVPALRGFRRASPNWAPDVILATGPPFSVFVVAAALARRHGTPWVADYRDLWTVGNEYWAHGRSPVRRFLDHRIERRLLRTVSRCVTVSEPLARSVRTAFGVRTDVVMNGIDRQPAESPGSGTAWRAALGVPPGTLLLAHTGLLYPGRRDPTPLLRALSLLGADRHRIHVVLAGPETGVAREAVARCGVADLVSVTGRVSAAESWQLQADADLLVLLMWDDPRDAGTVPGKLFDYLRARRPILAIGCADGVAADLIRSRGAGVVLNDPVAIADQLRAWLTEKRTTGRVSALPESALDGLFREDRMRAYLHLLGTVAAVRPGPARR